MEQERGYFVHPSSYVDEDVIVGKGTKVWHFCHLQSGCRIGENCSLGQNVNISNNVIVGDGCKLQNNVSLYEGVILEDHVFCGPSCVFTNDLTPRARYPKGRAAYKQTRICEGASIGANATIVCGHTVGAWAMIGAGGRRDHGRAASRADAGRSGPAGGLGVRMRRTSAREENLPGMRP